jgi:hypothetical protein
MSDIVSGTHSVHVIYFTDRSGLDLPSDLR